MTKNNQETETKPVEESVLEKPALEKPASFVHYAYKSLFLFSMLDKAGKEQGIYIRTLFPYLTKTGVVTTCGEVFLAQIDSSGVISFLSVEESVLLVTRQVVLEITGENL